MPDRIEILHEAARLTGGDRNDSHGDPKRQHAQAAALWGAYLGHRVTAEDVAICLALLKVSRIQIGAYNPDNYIDAAAYMGIAGECAAACEEGSCTSPDG